MIWVQEYRGHFVLGFKILEEETQMKNFRKVLALILVVATLFSFVAMASAKTLEDYSDASEVNYEEAVEVLSALGIINGYTDGTFKPAGEIEREEMAKMVAMLRNAGDFDASLYASANKFADAKGTWAEGYIAYCTQVGIVNGRNASTFDPDGKVTGVEVLKMLLCTLGYDAKEQGYVGANWQVNVLRDAKKSDMLEGLAAMDVYAPATREQAAQMFLNALKANMVYGYLSESIVKLTNSLYPIELAGNEKDFMWPATPDTNFSNLYEMAYCNAILSYVPLYTIFGGLVDMDGEMLDCFGRPATVWTVKNQYGAVILSKAFSATPDYEFTTDVELDVELGGLYGYKNPASKVVTYVNGVEDIYANTLVKASENTGNGVKTEVFIDDTVVTVVVIETFIGQVESVTKLPATVTLTNGYTFANTIGLQKEDYVLYHECAGDVKSPAALPKPGNHDDAIVVYNANNAKIGYIHDVAQVYPTVETVIHASRGLNAQNWLDDSYFQTQGAKFEYSATYGQDLFGREITSADILGWGATFNGVVPEYNVYDVYVNEYGYVMYVEEHEDKADYLYGYLVEDTQDANAGTIVNGQTVRAYAMDVVPFDGMPGTKTALVDQATEKYTWLASGTINGGNIVDDSDNGSTDYLGNLVRYEINKYGEIEVLDEEDWAVTGRDAYVVKGVAQIYGTPVIADRATQYMVRTWNWSTMSYIYNVYVGYQNLPETLFGSKPINNLQPMVIDSLQYLVSNDPDDDAHIATHVFIDATYAGTYQTFYLLNPVSHDSETALYPWLSGYTVYEALIDGQKAYVAATDWEGTGFGSINMQVENALYAAYMKVIDGTTINGLPLYLCMEEMEPVDWVLVNGPVNGLISVNDVLSLLGHGHIQIADEAPIHVVYHMYINEQFEKDYTYKTFAGETRDADFEAFFSYNDFASMNIYVTTEKVGDENWGEVREITEMWIELTEK